MTNEFVKPQMPNEEKKETKFRILPSIPKITRTIGQGDDAKNSLIYLTLRWAFVSGCIITGFIVLNHWFYRPCEKIPNFMGDVKMAWDIIIPVVTLSLGYAFGKSQK